MPQSRKRPGHNEHVEPSAIPASQRTRGRIVWAVLFAIFALVAVYFVLPDNTYALIGAAVAGAVIGYFAGKRMEKDL